MTYRPKYKIVHTNQDRTCYYCRPYKTLKKGSLAASVSGYPRCLNCGLKEVKKHRIIYERWIAEINSVIKDLNTKYSKELIVGRLEG